MQLNKYALTFLSFFIISFAQAQGLKVSDKPAEFLPDAINLMAISGNPQTEAIATNFSAWWNGKTISDKQKGNLALVTSAMFKKGYKAPQLTNLFETINQAVFTAKLSATNLDSFLEVLQKSADQSDNKTTMRYVDICRTYFASRALYLTNYNRLFALNGTLAFVYNEQKVEVNKSKTGEVTPTKATPNTWDDWGDAPVANADNTTTPEEAAPQFINAGPALSFSDVDLSIVTSYDSVSLIRTNCVLGIKDGVLLGTGGVITWGNVGISEAYVTLGNYSMNVRNPTLSTELATMTYPSKLITPVKGIFEFQSKKRNKNTLSTFPRFKSLANDVTLKNSGDIDYKGGFALIGTKVSSMSVASKYATIEVKKNGRLTFRATSKQFDLGDSLIKSPSATFIGYFATSDSIYHPLVKFQYNRKQQQLHLSKVDDGGFREASYSDSYHKLDITTDAMDWALNEQRMDFSIVTAKNVVPALFESFDYFNPERFGKISESYNFNPLLVVANYTRKNNLNSTTVTELARAFQKDANAIRPVFLSMMQRGYFNYDPEVENLILSRKGIHYLSVNGAKKDYDNFLISSFYSSNTKDTTANASINLKDNQMIIRGVKQFYLSDSLNVYMAPSDKLIRVNKDRNFAINGELKTGNFRFRGKDLSFNYNEFSVKLNKIDSITFVPQKELARKGRTEIGGDLKYDAGVIYINKPDNKSGRQRMPEYPRLVVPAGVTAYFDHPWRANGAYSQKIYFKVANIDFDSLNVKDVDFVGTFYSDGIFPPFKETLISMPDNSLGFAHKAPEGKYNLYNGKAFMKFTGPLIMDKKGLHAEGEINHLTAQIQAKDAIFTSDTVVAHGTSGVINEGTFGQGYFTKVAFNNFTLKWSPKIDSMLIETKGNDFDLYAGSTKLTGEILLKQSGIFGFGTVRRTDSETESNNFKFGKEAFSALPANLSVGSNLSAAKPALLGKNMNVNFNLATGLVSIKTPTNLKIQDSTSLFFPYTAYKTSINSAEWDINKKTITMKGDVRTSTFTSLDPLQEGLSFNGSEALYEIEKQSLNIYGVYFIKSADAKIFPDKGVVSIRRDAEMRGFYNAKLQVDTLNGYHTLVNGNIRILSKSKFEGDATYRFLNLAGDTLHVKMGNFDFKETVIEDKFRKKVKGYITTAKANIEEKDKFRLSSKLLYRGEITMLATEKHLLLDGYVRPDTKNRADIINWFAFKGNNTDNVTIDVQPNLKSDINLPIYAGLHFRNESGGLYTTFLGNKGDAKDEDLFVSIGKLRDIPKTSRFEIGPDDKEKSYEVNRYVYDDDKKTLNLEGNFRFFNPANYVQTAGFAQMRTDSGRYKFDQLMVLNFPIPTEVLKTMADKIVKANAEARDNASADEPEDREHLMAKLANVLGGKVVDPFERRIKNEHVALNTFNSKLNTTMVISKANLRYSDTHSSYYTVGKLSIATIGDVDINTEMEGQIEIRKTVDGDEFYLYLEASPDVWYYMAFLKNEMGVISSDNDFNAIVSTKAKGVKKGSGKNAYSFLGVGSEEKLAFVDRYAEMYRTRVKKTPTPKIPNAKKDTTTVSPTSKEDKEDLAPEKPEKKKEVEKEGF